MPYVVAAYLVVAALFAGYALSLISRQRVIADLLDAATGVGSAREARAPAPEAREPGRGPGHPPAS